MCISGSRCSRFHLEEEDLVSFIACILHLVDVQEEFKDCYSKCTFPLWYRVPDCLTFLDLLTSPYVRVDRLLKTELCSYSSFDKPADPWRYNRDEMESRAIRNSTSQWTRAVIILAILTIICKPTPKWCLPNAAERKKEKASWIMRGISVKVISTQGTPEGQRIHLCYFSLTVFWAKIFEVLCSHPTSSSISGALFLHHCSVAK